VFGCGANSVCGHFGLSASIQLEMRMRMQMRLRCGFEQFSWASRKNKKILSHTKSKRKQKREKLLKNSLGKGWNLELGEKSKNGQNCKTDQTWGKFWKTEKNGPMRTGVLIWWVFSPEKRRVAVVGLILV